MPVRVFVSSESKTDADRRRRNAAINEISRLGHIPVLFEGQPGRALREGEDPLDRCRALVRDSDLVLAIVDDTVSPAMRVELKEAEDRLGRERISYYFVRGSAKDEEAKRLWNRAKTTHVLLEPDSEQALRTDIGRVIASYVDDAVSFSHSGPVVLHNEPHLLKPGYYHWEQFELREGDRMVVTCESEVPFYGRLMDRQSFTRFRKSGGEIGMSLGSDGVSFTDEVVADRSDVWYVAIKYSFLRQALASIWMKVVLYRGTR